MTSPETSRIQDQLKRTLSGEAWHGPALQELLADVSSDKAAARPLPGIHSIWEIVLHITAWQNAARRMLEGQRIDLAPAQDWPAVPEPSDAEWEIALGDLEFAGENLRGAIAAFDPARLDQKVAGKPYSAYFMLHGVIHHNLYHAGQIAILKKA